MLVFSSLLSTASRAATYSLFSILVWCCNCYPKGNLWCRALVQFAPLVNIHFYFLYGSYKITEQNIGQKKLVVTVKLYGEYTSLLHSLVWTDWDSSGDWGRRDGNLDISICRVLSDRARYVYLSEPTRTQVLCEYFFLIHWVPMKIGIQICGPTVWVLFTLVYILFRLFARILCENSISLGKLIELSWIQRINVVLGEIHIPWTTESGADKNWSTISSTCALMTLQTVKQNVHCHYITSGQS
jgi:hypothetical protein